MDLDAFLFLSKLFKENGHQLYLVGGSSRDHLLKRESHDLDLATSAMPNEIKEFLPDANYRYAKFGSIRYKNIDITTLRVEGEYKDYRHPQIIRFTRDIKEDYKRRDFTINAIYIDSDFKIYDFTGGIDDLKNKIIRFIGDPETRVKEDPLRILRAERFSKQLGFTIEPNSLKAMINNRGLIEKLNSDKIKEEIRKSHL